MVRDWSNLPFVKEGMGQETKRAGRDWREWWRPRVAADWGLRATRHLFQQWYWEEEETIGMLLSLKTKPFRCYGTFIWLSYPNDLGQCGPSFSPHLSEPSGGGGLARTQTLEPLSIQGVLNRESLQPKEAVNWKRTPQWSIKKKWFFIDLSTSFQRKDASICGFSH